MLQNFEMIQIMEELKLARKLPNMLLQIGRFWLIYYYLWRILTSCPCPRTLNSGSVGMEHVFSASLHAWCWSPMNFEILHLTPYGFFSPPRTPYSSMAKSIWGVGAVRHGCLLLSWEKEASSPWPVSTLFLREDINNLNFTSYKD